MFGSWVLDVAIGLIVVFILFATICASVREGLEAWMKTRAAFLERGIRELLNDKDGTGLNRHLYEHPLIYPLFSGEYKASTQRTNPSLLDRGKNLPSYIPAQNFALALMDIVARGPVARLPAAGGTAALPATLTDGQPLSLDTLRARLGTIANGPVERALMNAFDTAEGDLDRARRNIEQWFDSTMERVSGWYRRKTNLVVFLLGLALAAALNIDTLAIAGHLYRNDSSRNALVALAVDAQTNPAVLNGPLTDRIKSSALFDERLQLPIGWSRTVYATPWYLMIAGWLLTAFAATLGAPFWFDVLNKVMTVRSTIASGKKTGTQESADPVAGSPTPVVRKPVTPGQRMAWAPAAPTLERRQTVQIPFDPETATTDVDGCGHADAPVTDDKDLPPAQGGIK